MPGEPTSGTAVTIGAVRVAGASPAAGAGAWRRAIDGALHSRLAGVAGRTAVSVPRLDLRLPAGSREHDVARALADAVARIAEGGRR